VAWDAIPEIGLNDTDDGSDGDADWEHGDGDFVEEGTATDDE
jgi:hypothetical protein